MKYSSRSYGISPPGIRITILDLRIWERLWFLWGTSWAWINSNCNRQNMPSVRCEMRLKKLLSFEHQGQPIVKVEYRFWRDADCKFPLLRYLDDGCQSAAEIMGNGSVKILTGRRRCWKITEQTQQKCYALRRIFNLSAWGIKTVHFSQQFLQ